jgi:hypothetical protein
MKKILILSGALLATTTFVKAQDLDYPDFRQKKDQWSRMAEKDIKSDLAAFTMAGIEESINKKPFAKIPLHDVNDNSVTYAGDGIKVFIQAGKFVPSKHKLNLVEDHLIKIDGRPFYGCYGVTPQTTIDSISVIVDKDTVAIPALAYKDIYNPSFSFSSEGNEKTRNAVYVTPDKKSIYIYMLGMGDRGTEYTFVIRDKKYVRRVLDWGVLK